MLKGDEHSKNCIQCEKDTCTNEQKYKRTDCTNDWWMVLSYIITQLMHSELLSNTLQLVYSVIVSFGLFGKAIMMLSIR